MVPCGRGNRGWRKTAWQTALREIREETGLTVTRLFSADCNEQFYEAGRNTFTVVPVFVAYVDSSQAVNLNAEHSESLFSAWLRSPRPNRWSPLADNAAYTKRFSESSLIVSHRLGMRSLPLPNPAVNTDVPFAGLRPRSGAPVSFVR